MMRVLRLGAFDLALDECSPAHQSLIESLFRATVEPLPSTEPVHLRLAIAAAQSGDRFGTGVALTAVEEDGLLHLSSDVVAGTLDLRPPEKRLRLRVNDAHLHVRHLDLYLRIVLNAVLRRLGRLRLHAAAVEVGGIASLFVGEKGAGKTTLCLHLAREGGTVLGEDQIMVRRSDSAGVDEFLVAGGDDLMRMTAKTETHFFRESPDGPSVEVAGVTKREIRARSHIRYETNLERPVRRIFFPRVGDTFDVQPLDRVAALSRIAAPLLPINRFTSAEDRRGFLDMLAGMTRQAECFTLTLTPDLRDLRQLSRFLLAPVEIIA
ncbi:MAG: hypothetical protein AB7J63_05260 [Vicinamibacterales bacterium]